MNKGFFQFLLLSWPFIIGCLLLSLHFWAKQISNLKPILNIKTFIGDWAIPIPTVLAVRIVITTLSCLFLAYPAFRDYSSIFPKFLLMEVFFDDEGTSKVIKSFNRRELAEFGLVENWRPEKGKYFEAIESKLMRRKDIPAPSQFKFHDPSFHVFSKGSTTFVVKKIAGFQTYKIVSADGALEHCCEKAGEATYKFTSEFELLVSPQKSISVKLWNIYLPISNGWTYILSPSFKQIFRNSEGEQCWDHTLVAVTKVRYFPIPSIGKTLYLYRPDPLGPAVPIGYVVYDTL